MHNARIDRPCELSISSSHVERSVACKYAINDSNQLAKDFIACYSYCVILHQTATKNLSTPFLITLYKCFYKGLHFAEAIAMAGSSPATLLAIMMLLLVASPAWTIAGGDVDHAARVSTEIDPCLSECGVEWRHCHRACRRLPLGAHRDDCSAGCSNEYFGCIDVC